MKIYLVDDSKVDLVRLERYVKQFAAESGMPVEIIGFLNPDAFLESYEKDEEKPYLVFMDIFMEGMNGIETAKRIREIAGKESRLIFTTSSADHAMEAFEVYADGYLKKPYHYEDFSKAMGRLEGRFKNESKVVVLRSIRQDITVHLGQIIFAEASGHKVNVHTDNNVVVANMSMKEIDKVLLCEPGFIHCGQSYIINIAKVKTYDKEIVELIDGTQIVIPVRLRKTVNEQLINYKNK